MSRTFKKNIRFHMAAGSNTKWYRKRYRKLAHRNNQILRENMGSEDEPIFEDIPKRDTWNEPTDGSWVVPKERYNEYRDKWWMRKKIRKQMDLYLKHKKR